MAKTKIKQDRHGPYVRGDGRLYRPEHPLTHSHLPDGTSLPVGTEVLLRPTSTVGRIQAGDATEVWHSHGCYFGPGGTKISSEEIYRPGSPTWWGYRPLPCQSTSRKAGTGVINEPPGAFGLR